jgi:hypothetical protein
MPLPMRPTRQRNAGTTCQTRPFGCHQQHNGRHEEHDGYNAHLPRIVPTRRPGEASLPNRPQKPSRRAPARTPQAVDGRAPRPFASRSQHRDRRKPTHGRPHTADAAGSTPPGRRRWVGKTGPTPLGWHHGHRTSAGATRCHTHANTTRGRGRSAGREGQASWVGGSAVGTARQRAASPLPPMGG